MCRRVQAHAVSKSILVRMFLAARESSPSCLEQGEVVVEEEEGWNLNQHRGTHRLDTMHCITACHPQVHLMQRAVIK